MPCINNPLANNSSIDDKLSSGYDNFAFNNDQQNQNDNNNERILTSVESLSHLLDNKPWLPRKSLAKTNPSHVKSQTIVFY